MKEDLLATQVVLSARKVRPDMRMEEPYLTANGNADRFAARHWGEVKLYQSGKGSVFYSVGADGRWLKGEGRTAGDVERRARDVVEEMRGRARALMMEGAAALARGDELGELEKEEAETKVGVGKSLASWAGASDNLGAMQTMARAACLTYGHVCTPDQDFDTRTDLLATPGGMLVLGEDGTVETRGIRADDMVTYSTSVDYTPGILDEGKMPALMREYLDTFIPDEEKQRLLFKALGTSLLGGNSYRLLLILKGESTTGKTQLVEALRVALGDYASSGNASVFRGNLDDKARPDILMLLRKRVAFLAEASKSWELHADRVKALTGGDALTVRRMRSDDFMEVVPHFTPVIYTNEMPRVNGADPALKRRMLVVDFDKKPAAEDPMVKQRFLASVEVRQWLFAALVRGFMESMAEGIEDVKDRFAMLTAAAFDDTTHLGEFFEWLRDDDQLVVLDEMQTKTSSKATFVTMKAMHERYMLWVKGHGNKQDKNDGLNYREFNEQLRQNYGWEVVNSSGRRWDGRILHDLAVSWL